MELLSGYAHRAAWRCRVERNRHGFAAPLRIFYVTIPQGFILAPARWHGSCPGIAGLPSETRPAAPSPRWAMTWTCRRN